MAQTGTIVVRKAGAFIPNAYLEVLLKANPDGWGAAIAQEDEGEKKLLLNSGDKENMSVEFLQDTMKTFDKNDITFYFCNSPDALSTEDLSPYILVQTLVDGTENEYEPKLVAFIEGNFPGYVQKGSSHPPEYHLVQEILIPKFESMYEMLDCDLDDVMETLKKPHFKKELLLTSVSRGTITLVAANGETITFAQNDLSGEYPWGWVSNTHGYEEGKPATAEVKPKKKNSMFPSRSTVREAAPSAAIAEAVVPPKTDTAPIAIKNYTTKKEKPPSHLSRKERKNWYKVKIGHCPQGWENSIAIDVYVGADGKVINIGEARKLGLQALALTNPPPVKDVETENIPQPANVTLPTGPELKQVTADILPIINPTARKNITEKLKEAGVQKTLADNADRIIDPKQVQALEAKFANFAAQLGMKSMDELGGWSDDMIDWLTKTNPNGAFVLIRSLLNEYLKMRTKVAKKEEAPVEAPPVKKPSMFPPRKAVA